MAQLPKTDDEWRQQLDPEQYKVLRESATEPPFSGKYVNFHESGEFTCVACGNVLFDSGTKFDSRSGWPSFYDAKPGAVELREDNSAGMQRTEVVCAKCGSHLGHLFEGEGYDTPTDKRFCINSLSLNFKSQTEEP